MKKVKNYLIFLLSISMLVFYGCEKSLDVPPPNQLSDQQIKDLLASGNADDIQLIMGSMANSMPLLFNKAGINTMGVADISYYTNQGLSVMRTLEANDMVLGDQPISNVLAGATEYNLGNFQGPTAVPNSAYWYYAWELVTKANQMLDFLTDDIVGNNSFLQDAKARGLVIRAYAYSYLMENYQDAYAQGGSGKLGMPIYTNFNPNQELKPRSSVEETYNFIKGDLNTAISLLQSAGTGFTKGNTQDIDLGVANFILARVSLVSEDYTTAISAADKILSNYPDLMSESQYGGKNTGSASDPVFDPGTNGFLNNDVNPEVILGFPLGTANTYFNNLMNPFGEGYGGLNRAFKRIDNRLYSQIADDDYRKDCFVGGTAFGDFTYPTNGTVVTLPSYINLKFAATKGLDGVDIHANETTTYYMRTSEVVLMKAEALAKQGNNSEAEATLNKLLAARTKSGATALTVDNYPGMSGMSTIEKVQLQTRIEMWGEGGLEFYNNRRWNIPINRSNSANHINKGSLSVSEMTMKIPVDEMNNNPNMVQN